MSDGCNSTRGASVAINSFFHRIPKAGCGEVISTSVSIIAGTYVQIYTCVYIYVYVYTQMYKQMNEYIYIYI